MKTVSLLNSKKKKDKIQYYGPVSQGDFLCEMGIKLRLVKLVQNVSEEKGLDLLRSVKRLIDKEEMGEIYKVVALLNSNIKEKPHGFDPPSDFLKF